MSSKPNRAVVYIRFEANIDDFPTKHWLKWVKQVLEIEPNRNNRSAQIISVTEQTPRDREARTPEGSTLED